MLKILQYPNPILFNKMPKLECFDVELKTDAEKMFELMYFLKGVGLAANQVGINKRLFVMHIPRENKEPYVFVNPEILSFSNEDIDWEEGCLSFPELHLNIKRKKDLILKWQDLDGNFFEKQFDGFEAVCIQHEMDHLDGIVFINRLSQTKKTIALQKFNKIKRK